uniref:Uncharacterized protein n=1 Tax=Anopheles coluzzii TaxID=1518534 RepID=A0A8W7PQX0_ANOCL
MQEQQRNWLRQKGPASANLGTLTRGHNENGAANDAAFPVTRGNLGLIKDLPLLGPIPGARLEIAPVLPLDQRSHRLIRSGTIVRKNTRKHKPTLTAGVQVIARSGIDITSAAQDLFPFTALCATCIADR